MLLQKAKGHVLVPDWVADPKWEGFRMSARKRQGSG
jgi:hypothetical protein